MRLRRGVKRIPDNETVNNLPSVRIKGEIDPVKVEIHLSSGLNLTWYQSCRYKPSGLGSVENLCNSRYLIDWVVPEDLMHRLRPKLVSICPSFRFMNKFMWIGIHSKTWQTSWYCWHIVCCLSHSVLCWVVQPFDKSSQKLWLLSSRVRPLYQKIYMVPDVLGQCCRLQCAQKKFRFVTAYFSFLIK